MFYYNRLTGECIAQPAGFYGTTSLQPPTLEQNQCAIFVNDAWQVVPDFRGVKFYRKGFGNSVSLGLGAVPGADLVTVARPSKFHSWQGDGDGAGWQIDYSLVRADLLDRVATFRRTMETAGITVGDVAVDTSRTSQAMLTQAYASLQAGFIQSVDWKGADGWHALTKDQVTGLAQAVASHVESCFTKEKNIGLQIAALADESLNTFDIAAAWAAA